MMRSRVNRRKAMRQPLRIPKIRVNWKALLLPPAIAAVLAAVLLMGRTAFDRPVGALVVEGAFQRVTAIQVQAAAASSLQSGFLSLDLRQLRSDVAALDWVDSVSASRVWPNVVRVRITEHLAAASWGEGGLLNVRGELFTTNARHLYAELPKLSGPQGSEHEVARLYLEVRDRLADAQLSLESLSMDARGAVAIVLASGQEIKLGRRDIEARLDRFFTVAAPALATDFDRVDYIDLRYTNGFAVGWDEQAAVGLADVRSDSRG
jgi:cell division protein FtsQ